MAWSGNTPSLGTQLRGQFTSLEVQNFKGPYPPPQMIAAYERALPGLGREIMDGFVEERKHRHAIQSRRANADIDAEKRGQWFAFILSVVLAGVATLAFYWGHPAAASTVVGVNLIGLATIFISGKKLPKSETAGQGPQQTESQ
jgi:uncharacterized membrane protein